MYLVDAGNTIPASREISISTLPKSSRQRAFQTICLASAHALVVDLLLFLFFLGHVALIPKSGNWNKQSQITSALFCLSYLFQLKSGFIVFYEANIH